MFTVVLLFTKRVITGRSSKVIILFITKIIVLERDITVFTTVQKVKKVIIGRSLKVITLFTTVQNVTTKSSCWDETPLIVAMFIAEVKENVIIESSTS